MRFGPKRSPRRPVISSGTAYASRYADVTHTTLSRLLVSGSSAALIAGFATETIVVSTRIMKNPMTRAQRAGHGLRWGVFEGADATASVCCSVIGVRPFGLRDSVRRAVPAAPTGSRGARGG